MLNSKAPRMCTPRKKVTDRYINIHSSEETDGSLHPQEKADSTPGKTRPKPHIHESKVSDDVFLFETQV